jgi:hypothetical protein
MPWRLRCLPDAWPCCAADGGRMHDGEICIPVRCQIVCGLLFLFDSQQELPLVVCMAQRPTVCLHS